jgi:hypothetical protein
MDNSSWWHDISIWRNAFDYDTVSRPTECEALENIYHQVLKMTPKQKRALADWLVLEGVDFCRAILRDMKRDANLKDKMAARGKTLNFVNVGTPKHERLMSVEVSLP